MKIVFILPAYDTKPIGAFKVVYQYANEMAGSGHEVTCVHPRRLASLKIHPLWRLYLLLENNVGCLSNPLSRPRRHWHPMDSRVRMLYVPEPTPARIPDADVVFATLWATAEYVVEYPPQKGKKCYIIQGYETWSWPKERVDATWRAPLAKIVVSRGLYELGLELGVPRDAMTHIPNWIDHTKYRILQPIEGRSARIAMLYHPAPIKGAADSLSALAIARTRFPSLQAVFFGIRPRPKTLPHWIEYHRQPSNEVLVGHIYNGSSIYMSPTWTEGFGLPPAEAMACGCAVVSTDTMGVKDFCEPGVTALLSPPKSPEALAANIVRLLEDDDLRMRLANAGHARIQEFTRQRSMLLFEQFLAQLPGSQSTWTTSQQP